MSAVAAASKSRAEIKVSPITGVLGAEVSGVDLSGPISAESMAGIRSALDKHFVLFFRDQRLTPTQLQAFTSAFGPMFHHPVQKSPFKEAPEVLELRKEPGGKLFGGEYWHSDVTWLDPAGYVSVLHGI